MILVLSSRASRVNASTVSFNPAMWIDCPRVAAVTAAATSSSKDGVFSVCMGRSGAMLRTGAGLTGSGARGNVFVVSTGSGLGSSEWLWKCRWADELFEKSSLYLGVGCTCFTQQFGRPVQHLHIVAVEPPDCVMSAPGWGDEVLRQTRRTIAGPSWA